MAVTMRAIGGTTRLMAKAGWSMQMAILT